MAWYKQAYCLKGLFSQKHQEMLKSFMKIRDKMQLLMQMKSMHSKWKTIWTASEDLFDILTYASILWKLLSLGIYKLCMFWPACTINMQAGQGMSICQLKYVRFKYLNWLCMFACSSIINQNGRKSPTTDFLLKS